MAKTTVPLDFRKVSSIPASGLTTGTIYFDDTKHVIKVATSSTTTETYSGVRDASWDASTSVLNIVQPDGDILSIDFSGLDSIEDVNNLRAGIGFAANANSYGASGISDTSYLNTIDSSTVIGALKTLDAHLHAVESAAGVVSIGGASGVITLKGDGSTNGDVNLTMTGQQLGATIVGLGSAAFTDSSTYDASGAAAAVLGTNADSSTTKTVYGLDAKIDAIKADSSVSLVETAGSGDILKVYTIKQGDVSVGNINIPKDFLVKSGDVSTCTVQDQPVAGLNVGDKYLDFVVNTKDSSDGSGTESHIYIPVKDLTDIYTGGNTTTIDVSVSSSNVITAVLNDNAVTTGKIADGAVTDVKLDASIREQLERADTATIISTVNKGAVTVEPELYINTSTIRTDSSYVSSGLTLETHDGSTYLNTGVDVHYQDVSTASSVTDGVATAYDVQQYVQTYVAEQLAWTQFADR